MSSNTDFGALQDALVELRDMSGALADMACAVRADYASVNIKGLGVLLSLQESRAAAALAAFNRLRLAPKH